MSELTLDLPEGWFLSDEATRTDLEREYSLELPPIHPLAGVPVRVIADRQGMNDDILVQHLNELDRFSVVHLSWVGRQEVPDFPCVDFDGSFADFIAWEQLFLGETRD
jgi:hypothetical protein